jgi:putative DNA primase/helicase
MPITWSGCFRVSNSKFVDVQRTQKSFSEFVEGFKDPTTFKVVDRKEALPLFMPAEYARIGARRCAANVLRVHMLVLDFDRGTPAQISKVLENAARYGMVAYTSFSHDPEGQWKFRTVTKLSRPVDQTEWSKFFPRAVDALGATGLNDIKCADACHMYYVPGGDRAKYRVVADDGDPLDVDAVLQRSLPKGAVEEKQKIFPEVLEEKDRAQIDEALKLVWDAKLSNLADEVAAAPFPGSIYHLKSHAVFGIARGIPHIVGEERVRKIVRSALEQRYNGHAGDDIAEAYKFKSFKQVDDAIEQGKSKPWWPPKVEEVDAHALTDVGLRKRLLDKHHQNLAHEPTWDRWLVWRDTHWDLEAGNALAQEKMVEVACAIETEETQVHVLEVWRLKELHDGVKDDKNASEEIKALAEYNYEQAKKRLTELAKFAEKAQHVARVSAGVSLASSDPRILVSSSKFNQNHWALNFLNGTLDLQTGKLREHRREDLITRIIPHEFRDMPTPYFDKFLHECMLGDQALIDFIWRLIGYSAIGVTSEQILIICYGDGANGKSTFLRILLEMFGHGPSGYGHAAQSSNLLTNKGSEQHATWRMGMFGKRIVICQEVEEGKTLAESQLKELTGSDLVTGRKMRQDEWSYVPEFTPWLGCNSLPHIRGIDEGVWRRFVILPWRASFKGREDRSMFEKLKAEIPGIWARAAREAVAWRESGKLILPQAVLESGTEYRISQDPLGDFLDKWCVIEPNAFVTRANVWNAYDEYCQDTRQRIFHERKRFYAALEKTAKVLGDAFVEHKRNGVRGFISLRLKDPKERVDASPRVQLQKAFEAENKKPDEKN